MLFKKKKKNSHKDKRFIHSTRQIDSNVTGHEEPRAMHPDFTQKLIFRKPALVEFWCSIKKEHPQLSEKALTLSFIKQLSAWGGAVFRGMNRTTQHNRDSSGSRRV